MLQPNLSTFITYASATGASRKTKAQKARIQLESEYAVETDFWKRMRSAIVKDRKTTRDATAVMEAVDQATAKKLPSFLAVANVWPTIIQRWSGASFRKPPSGLVTIGGLEVAVRPLFSEVLEDGTVEHVVVWMNRPEPSELAIRGAMRLVTKIDDDPHCRAAFIDARRGNIWIASSAELEREDSWLEGMGAAFVRDAA